MVQKLKIENQHKRLRELFGQDWFEVLEPFLTSEAFLKIAKMLKAEVKRGEFITPNFSDMFRAFKECPIEKLHTVIIGQDPYPGVTEGSLVADGLAFSSRCSKKCPASLSHIYKAIDDTILGNKPSDLYSTFDLTKWANQGILLLNTSLSTVVGTSDAHSSVWRPFIVFVLSVINKLEVPLAVIMMGAKARSFKPIFTNKDFYLADCEHPAAAGYRNGKWNHEDCLMQLDAYQEYMNNIKIKW